MALIFDSDISGASNSALGGSFTIEHWELKVLTFSTEVGVTDSASPKRLLRFGTVSFGVDNGGTIWPDRPGAFYYPDKWIDYELFRMVPDFVMTATNVRWFLNAANTAHLKVFST
jgi:hypothetical protein